MTKTASILLIAMPCISLALSQTAQDVDARVEDLLLRMTLEEKVGQLVQYSGISEAYKAQLRQGRIGSLLNVTGAANTNAIQQIAVKESRLGIPLLFGLDVIHGYRTIFPIPLAEASSWDPQLVERCAAIAAREAAASGVRWTFAPMVDIAREPRWGRIAEGAGEDPHLGAVMAAARVRGFQGSDLSNPESIVACAKHYVAYGAAEGGRDYNTVDISDRTLREIYLPPFKAAVAAGAGTLMSAFNELSGIPASASRFTLTDILRGEWKFQGFVVSDWNAIGELLTHGSAGNAADAAREAITAGVDMDMEGRVYINQLPQLVQSGAVKEELITEAARRVLRIKVRTGLFDRPYIDPTLEGRVLMSPEHIAAAREAAQKSIVLLKNRGDLLPLSRNLRSIAVIGPLADSKSDPLGSWSAMGKPEDVVTVLEAVRGRFPSGAHVSYAKGCDVDDTSFDRFSEAVRIARQSEVVIAVVGESADMSGEAASRSSLDLPGNQNRLLQALVETGTPLVVVLMNGRPLAISWAARNVPAILECWYLGVQSGTAIADVLVGDINPSGKLPVSFPFSTGQIPVYYNHKNTGRPGSGSSKWTSKYLDNPLAPLFPFGFGLSYTTFSYTNLQLSSHSMDGSGQLTVSADVQNAGAVSGDEIVQLYTRDLVASVTRPVKELKDFRRVTLAPGEKRRVEFLLTAEALKFYDRNMQLVTEPGAFKVWIGPNSAEGLEGNFEIK